MIPVFYRPEQSCDEAVRLSPSAGKPSMVISDWLSTPSISAAIEVKSFEPAATEALYAAHSKAYVDGVLSCQRANGFGTKSPNIAASLRYTTGSMIAAATHVLSNKLAGLNVAVSPTSGFHHAAHSDGGGFCTFNGLMATAIHMHALGLAKRILIVDMDQHYGDGTDGLEHHVGHDYCKLVMYDPKARCTQRNVQEQHAGVLMILDLLTAEALAIYAPDPIAQG